jgi:hypothetical protein
METVGAELEISCILRYNGKVEIPIKGLNKHTQYNILFGSTAVSTSNHPTVTAQGVIKHVRRNARYYIEDTSFFPALYYVIIRHCKFQCLQISTVDQTRRQPLPVLVYYSQVA